MHRRDEFRAEQIMIDKLVERSRTGNVEIVYDHVLDEVLGDDRGVTGVAAQDTAKSGDSRNVDVQGVFIAIGHTPNTGVFQGQLEMDGGYIVTRTGRKGFATATSVAGRIRRRRRRRSDLSAGRDIGRLGLHGRARRRALPHGRLSRP